MSGRNGQRKPGTTRGSPRRSRTAKAARISRPAVKSRCASEWGGWGRLSVDGPGHYNPAPSEGPWGGGLLNPPRRWITESSARHRAGAPNLATESTKGGRKPNCRRGMPGAGFTWCCLGKAPSERPAFQPYWGKPAVRNDRGGRGNVGIIRSPVRASALPNWEPWGKSPGRPGSSIRGPGFPFRKRNKGVYTLERSRTNRQMLRFSHDFCENLRRWTRVPGRISRACRHRYVFNEAENGILPLSSRESSKQKG
jgi:hypothetical protein